MRFSNFPDVNVVVVVLQQQISPNEGSWKELQVYSGVIR